MLKERERERRGIKERKKGLGRESEEEKSEFDVFMV